MVGTENGKAVDASEIECTIRRFKDSCLDRFLFSSPVQVSAVGKAAGLILRIDLDA